MSDVIAKKTIAVSALSLTSRRSPSSHVIRSVLRPATTRCPCTAVIALCRRALPSSSTRVAHDRRSRSAWTLGTAPSSVALETPTMEGKSAPAATDHWLEVNGVATRVLCCGRSVAADGDKPIDRLLVFVCGNPGVTVFYERFLEELHKATGIPAWVVSHAGHEMPPANSELRVPDQKAHPELYTLQGQVEHKLRFVEKYVPDKCELYLAGHSIGTKIISEMLKDETMTTRVNIKQALFFFPTLKKMRDTPNGHNLITMTSYLLSTTLFLSWIFTTFPNFIKKSLVKMTLMIMEGRSVDDYLVRSGLVLVHPTVLRNVFAMALDEMDKVYELDSKVLNDNASKLHMYFGNCDGWVPVPFYDEIHKQVPEAEAVLCDKGYQHAFVLRYSDEIAAIATDWINKDLKK
ncbi:lipid droplet-associated hydrolase [Adelges cooleyi]|uniref:lipid droplet-associated hydrolase n=1 Tax=Adelges cooleyi TaxID=133065 RepID=UPI00217FABC8|nr:lipid droplet-associated hydrolase [Adelges cooleyi]